MTNPIPPEIISALALIGGILCFLTFRKLPNMLRSSVVAMFQVGMMFIGPTCIAIGFLYAYFDIYEPDFFVRQMLIRVLWVYFLGGIDIWQVFILLKGKNL